MSKHEVIRRCDFDAVEYIADSGDMRDDNGDISRHAIVRVTDNKNAHQREKIRCEYYFNAKHPEYSYATASVWIPVIGWSEVTKRLGQEMLDPEEFGDEFSSDDFFFDMWFEVFEVRR